jgi:hypothetical protein
LRYSFPYNSWTRLTALGITSLMLTGCSLPYVNRHIEAVNAEYQELSAYSYELERQNQQLCDEIERLRSEIEELKGEPPRRRTGPYSRPLRSTTPRSPSSGTTSPRSPASEAPPSLREPEIEIPDSSEPSLPAVVPPENSPRSTPTSPNRLSPGSGSPRTPVSSQKPVEHSLQLLPPAPKPPRPILEDPPPAPTNINDLPANELPPPADGAGLLPEPADPKVTHLFLNPIRTRGANFDSDPGDDGIALVLEPRNQAGEFVPQAGRITVSVLDPTKQGDAARLALWHLDEKLVRQRISRSNQSRGIQLQLPWPGAVPETNQVKLYVRYETADGRRVHAQHDLILNPSAHASQRWTPRAGERSRGETQFAADSNKPKTVEAANPPLPPPPVQSDLTKVTPPADAPKEPQVIREPAAPQTDVAENHAPAVSTPPQQPVTRPQWQPFR